MLGFFWLVTHSFWLFTSIAAWQSPRSVVSTYLGSLRPELCQARFWKLRFTSYCDIVAWNGVRNTDVSAQPPLNVFEVYTPVRVGGKYLANTGDDAADGAGDGARECTVLLMNHTFAYSYGMPFVGNYTPPNCSWTHVLFNLSMTSQGRQYDRLALMFLGDIEVFRTSTAEPTTYGIVTNYIKDMTRYSALFREPQTIIFDLGNLISDVYTGSFNTTLTATFYSPEPVEAANPADSIFPISQHLSSTGQPSHFQLPAQNGSSAITLPQNTVRAIVSVSASGNSEEEFWYTNVPTSYINTFASTPDGPTLYGYSPFREVQVLVDGQLAGVAWPFITIFTGGIVPALWRPIVSITAYDLPEYEVDITPLLPLLVDGTIHTFEIRVVSYDETTNTISTELGSNWLASGRVFVWTDKLANHTTTGTVLKQSVTEPSFTFSPALSQTSNGTNSTLEVTISAQRSLQLESIITTSSGNLTALWSQDLFYTNYMNLSNSAVDQWVVTATSGTDSSTDFGTRNYSYPLTVYQFFNASTERDVNIASYVTQGLDRDGIQFLTTGSEGGAGTLSTNVVANATWKLDVGGNGTSMHNWTWSGNLENAEGVSEYERIVSSVNTVNKTWIASDSEEINGVVVL